MDDLEFALHLADLADSISLPRFGASDLRIDHKPNGTEVTDVDCQVEATIRQEVAQHRPGDRVLGEEYGGDTSVTGRRWVVDPVDGTRAFIRGNELWGTLIALQEDGVNMVSVASVPAMGQRYSARRGGGATLNRTPLSVSTVARLDEAMLAHTSLKGFIRAGTESRFRDLVARCWDARGLGNSVSHLSVARGTADIGWTAQARIWDFAALALIVEEAGGRFCDGSGDGVDGGPGLSSNGRLHPQLLAAAGVPARD